MSQSESGADALERELRELVAMLDELRVSRVSVVWAPAKVRLDAKLETIQATISRAQRDSITSEARNRVDRLSERLEELDRTARQIPPPVSREIELMEIIATPINGGASAGYAAKEAEMQEILAQLDHAESRALAIRLRMASPEDPLATILQRWTAERRGRVIAFLEDSRRREAVRREAELRSAAKKT